jgi:hypothetical protein
MPFILSANFTERLLLTSTCYDALIAKGFSKRCNRKSSKAVHNNTCAGIHSLKDASNITGIFKAIALERGLM